ncbi:unnamed protein product [Eruca vesicaria subsp. sativa]|uniref:Stizolobate synthase n=1 Tax=Eruca vesicaria subsp. sativa TaxID=29727 RepID=A0ABC8J401_ERUVS|nr:unnamed protein product [Eruca vesicaria subsp. sativa]
MGKALAPLKEEGVLIISSGSATHNPRKRGTNKAPNPRMAHPWPEHLYPLHIAMGAANDDVKVEQIHTSWTSTLSYSSYRFTSSL